MVDGRWWRVSAAAAVGLVIALPVVLREPAAKAVQETGEPTRESAASVRVEHEFVTPDAEVPEVVPTVPSARSLRQPKPSPTFTARQSTVTVPASTFTKARQKFLGDGRHRPEPFPRVR